MHILVDGVSSQRLGDRSVALQRLAQSGAFLATSEMVGACGGWWVLAAALGLGALGGRREPRGGPRQGRQLPGPVYILMPRTA